MMLSRVVCFAVVFGAVMADPAPCCFSRQFQTSLFAMNSTLAPGSATPVTWDNTIEEAYDYDNKILAVNVSFMDPASHRMSKVSVWEDYNAMTQYTLTAAGCQKIPLDHAMAKPCIPDDFSFGGSYSIGSSANRIRVNVFRGIVGRQTMVFHVTDDNCTPVSLTQYGDNGKATEALQYIFRDVKTTIDPSAIVVPDICKKAQSDAVKYIDMERVKKLRSHLKL